MIIVAGKLFSYKFDANFINTLNHVVAFSRRDDVLFLLFLSNKLDSSDVGRQIEFHLRGLDALARVEIRYIEIHSVLKYEQILKWIVPVSFWRFVLCTRKGLSSLDAIDDSVLNQVSLIYARMPEILLLFPRSRLPIIVEAHNPHFGRSPVDKAIVRVLHAAPARALITIAPFLKDVFVRRGLDASRVHVMYGAAPLLPAAAEHIVSFGNEESISMEEPVKIRYFGSIDVFRGLDLIGAIPPELGVVEVWGKVHDQGVLATVQRYYKGVMEQSEVLEVICERQVLIAPYSSHVFSAQFMSPVKVYEYLSTGNPIVLPRMQVLQEQFAHQPAVFWYEPDNQDDFLVALRAAIAHLCSGEKVKRQVRDFETRVREINEIFPCCQPKHIDSEEPKSAPA